MAPTTDVRVWAETRKAFIGWVNARREEALQLLQDDLDQPPRYYFDKNTNQYATEFYSRVDRWRRWASGLTSGLNRRIRNAQHLVADAATRFAEEHLLVFNVHDFKDPSTVRRFDLRDRITYSSGTGWMEIGEWFRRGREEPTWNHVRQTLANEVRAFTSMVLEQINDLELVPLDGDLAIDPTPAESEAPAIIDETSRFTQLERQGDGAHASVWKAHDDALNRIVALRIVRSSAGGDQEAIAHARTMAKPPPHPNIVTVYELVSIRDPEEGRSVVAAVMEFIDGEKLRSVHKRQLVAADALRVCNGILAALEHYHQHGFAHLDLHADNVLVSRASEAKVLDPRTYRTEAFATTQLARDQCARDVTDATFLIREVLTHSQLSIDVALRFHETAGDATSISDLRAALTKATAAPPDASPRPRAASAETPITDPAAVLAAALEHARANDMLGWRLLEDRVRRSFVERLLPWRADHEGRWAGDRNREGGSATTDSLLEIAMPRLILPLVAAYSRHQELRDQRKVVEDLLFVPGWSRGGTTAIVEAPRAMVFLLHYLYGALCLATGQPDRALDFAELAVAQSDRDETRPLWKQHDLTGWPMLLGGTCTWAWEYLSKLRERHEVLGRLFALQSDYDVGLNAYSILLSMNEFGHDAAKAKPTDLSNIENIRLDVPPLFAGINREVLAPAVRQTCGERRIVALVAQRTGANAETMRQMWPSWKKLVAKFGRDVYERYWHFDELPLGELA